MDMSESYLYLVGYILHKVKWLFCIDCNCQYIQNRISVYILYVKCTLLVFIKPDSRVFSRVYLLEPRHKTSLVIWFLGPKVMRLSNTNTRPLECVIYMNYFQLVGYHQPFHWISRCVLILLFCLWFISVIVNVQLVNVNEKKVTDKNE